jgi:hypothetical protein
MNLRTHLPQELPETGFKGPERRAINQIIKALRRLEPVASPNETVTIGPQGTSRKSTGGGTGDNNSNLPRWL